MRSYSLHQLLLDNLSPAKTYYILIIFWVYQEYIGYFYQLWCHKNFWNVRKKSKIVPWLPLNSLLRAALIFLEAIWKQTETSVTGGSCFGAHQGSDDRVYTCSNEAHWWSNCTGLHFNQTKPVKYECFLNKCRVITCKYLIFKLQQFAAVFAI